MEKELIEQLWKQTNATIKNMGRPERLYPIDPNKTALIVIDMQDGFCATNGCLENPDTRSIVSNINSLTKRCKENNIPVIWVRFIVKNDLTDAGLWPLIQPKSPYEGRNNPMIEFSDAGNEINIWKELIVDQKDYQIIKNRYSAFIPGSSEIEGLLKQLNRDTLIITGVGTNVCCESTARDAMMLNYKVVAVSDANATVGKIFHEVSLMNIKSFFGDVVTTTELLKEL